MGKTLFLIVLILIISPAEVSAAHFIVGRINDALDGTPADGRMVLLWNPSIGENDNLTDVIGIGGNSGQSNTYLIDCELLNSGCSVGDELYIRVLDSGDGYVSENASVNVTGSGFDLVSNITLNSPPNISSVLIEDSLAVPSNEIDLIAASTRDVTCEYVVEEYDNESLQNVQARIFHSSSFYEDGDDNNFHYTNSSCFVNSSYGNENQSYVSCGFQMEYYSNSGSWTCVGYAEDILGVSGNFSDVSSVNSLLSVGIDLNITYSVSDVGNVSDEVPVNVTNYGNVDLNLSLYGYADSEGDGLAMNCSTNGSISVEYEKYNLTSSNPGDLTLSQFENLYKNLTSSLVVNDFGLNYRVNDAVNDALNTTYWRIYVPQGIEGSCNGNIVFGASTAPG